MFFLSFKHRKRDSCKIVKVIKESYIDKTDKTGRFVAVTVQFKSKFSKPITLESIKKNKDLSHLALIKQSRLSVMPVDYKSWKIINNMSKDLKKKLSYAKKKKKLENYK